MSNSQPIVTVGRRKTASARVRLAPGAGAFTVNGKDLKDYCYHEGLQRAALAPFRTTETSEKQFDVTVLVSGSGPVAQATAIAHGIARALEKHNADLRASLKKAGHLTRDPRMRERKKPGRPGARKRFQFSKR